MKKMKKFFETLNEQFNSLSVNLKLTVINAVVALLGIGFGVFNLRAAYTAGWWSRVFHSEQIVDQKTYGWILVSLGGLALSLAVFFYIKEELRYKKIMKELETTLNTKEEVIDAEAIPC